MQVRKNKMLAYTPRLLLKHMRTHTHMHKCMHAHMHKCMHAHMQACTHTLTHTCMHTCTHACMHTPTHTHTHTQTNAHTCMQRELCVVILIDANYTCFIEQKLFLVVIHCIVTMCLLLRLRVPFWKVTFHDLLFLF